MYGLDGEHWAEVRRLFATVLELPEQQRAAFLEAQCSQEEVRREVLSLLDYYEPDDTLGAPPGLTADDRLLGRRLGAYKIESIIGHGGMGAVYRAARDDGEFQQVVAIKLVRAAAQSPKTLQRFRQERQILARLAHPNIARLLDGGSTGEGVPFLVMEFIDGEAVTDWCDRRGLDIEGRLRLFLDVCEAMEFAHGNSVLHRDLKPGNILVTAAGVPKLIDFGIAKIVSLNETKGDSTAAGIRTMTPEYASPEQVMGEPLTAAADVYALGLCLYELLTRKKAQEIPEPSPGSVARVVCQTEPAAPAKVRPELTGDLDNIIRMALRKEPGRRYALVADLARDIRLHLDGRPVRARPDNVGYRTAKFLKRNRAAVIGGLVMTLLFAAFALTLRLSAPRIPRVLAVTQLTQTGNIAGEGTATDGAFVYCVIRSPGAYTLAKVPAKGGTPLALSREIAEVQLLDISPDGTSLLLSSGVALEAPLWMISTAGGRVRRIGNFEAYSAGWGPDGRSVVFVHENNLFESAIDGSGIRKLAALPGQNQQLRCFPGRNGGVIRFSTLPEHNSSGRIWEINRDGTGLHVLFTDVDPDKTVTQDSGTWTAGGKYFLFRSVPESTYHLFAVQEHRGGLGLPPGRPSLLHSSTSGIFWPVPSPDSKRIYYLSGLERREFVRFDRNRREFVPFLAGVAGRYATFSRDGRRLAYTVAPQETLWISRADGRDARQLDTGGLRVSEPSWSPNGDSLVFTGRLPNRPVGIYQIAVSGGPPARLTPEGFNGMIPSWSPDGGTLLVGRDIRPGTNKLDWHLMDMKTHAAIMLPDSYGLGWASWSPDGRYIAARDNSGLRLFDIQSRTWKTLLTEHGISGPFWSKSGKHIIVQSYFQPDEPIWRVSIDGERRERVASARQIPQTDLTHFHLAGLAPDDTPVAALVRENIDLYALEMDLP